MTYPSLRIVAAPDESAAVLFDFNTDGDGTDAERHLLADGFSVGVPALEGDPDAVLPMYGPRVIQGALRIEGPKYQALAAQSSLARALSTERPWARFQLDADSQVVWFSLYRSQYGDLSFDAVYVDRGDHHRDQWQVGFELPAEPFAYGARRSLGTFVVPNDPTATSGCHFTLPEVVGDVAAPLRLEVTPSTAKEHTGYRWMFASHSGATSRTPVVWDLGTGDGFTNEADTAVTVDAAMVGGSRRTCTFATQPTFVSRISGTPSTPVEPGCYKVLLLVGRGDATAQFKLAFGQDVGGTHEYGATVTTNEASLLPQSSGHMAWVDMGNFEFPKFRPPVGEDQGDPYSPTVAIKATDPLTSGAELWLDAILLVPLETADTSDRRVMFAHFPDLGIEGGGTGHGIFDGDYRAVWAFNNAGAVSQLRAETQGDYPRAVPGAENTLTVLQQTDGRTDKAVADPSDDPTATTSVTVTYQPRYVWIGDS